MSSETGRNTRHRGLLHIVVGVLQATPLLMIPGLLAWLTGRHMIFPSLGPTAYVLGVRGGPVSRAWPVIGGHLIGVIAGLLAYHALAQGVAIKPMPEAMSWDSLRLVFSGFAALALTVAGMLMLNARHTSACSTTLIIALGELSRWSDGLLIMAGVIAMYLTYRILLRREHTRDASPASHEPP